MLRGCINVCSTFLNTEIEITTLEITSIKTQEARLLFVAPQGKDASRERRPQLMMAMAVPAFRGDGPLDAYLAQTRLAAQTQGCSQRKRLFGQRHFKSSKTFCPTSSEIGQRSKVRCTAVSARAVRRCIRGALWPAAV